MISTSRTARLLAALLVGTLVAVAGCTDDVREEQRKIVVKSRVPEEAYDAASAVLTQRFDSINPEETNRERGEVVTTWRPQDEPNRLTRRRARAWVLKGPEDGTATVEVQVERQISTAKTSFGELDKQKPVWVGGGDTADTTLEREILLAIRQRLSGRVQ